MMPMPTMRTRFVITCSQSFAADQQTAIRRVPQEQSFTARPAKPAAHTRAESQVLDLRKRMRERDAPSAGANEIRILGPSRKEPCFRALITRNSLTITPPHFRLGSIPDASRESREQQRQRLSPQPSPWLRRPQLRNTSAAFRSCIGI